MNFFVILGVALLVGIDQAAKYLALHSLKPVGSITVIENIFSLTFVENRGAAFGILQGHTILLAIVSIFITVLLLYFYIKMPQGKVYKFIRFSLVLIISGAIGNLIDRFLRGYVVDFFHATFIDFPVFNVADIYVVVGSIFMAILVTFFLEDDKKKEEK